ncbi:MAG TPA: hypothetical protein PKW49_08500 [Paludibacteraceae bacterium]|nr:hypothetical protein [Paludibacteraceae bacterium]
MFTEKSRQVQTSRTIQPKAEDQSAVSQFKDNRPVTSAFQTLQGKFSEPLQREEEPNNQGLQQEAEVMRENAVQRKENRNVSQSKIVTELNPTIQRVRVQAGIQDYIAAYNQEINQTNTLDALNEMDKGKYQYLMFSENGLEWGVTIGTLPEADGKVNEATPRQGIVRLTLPKPLDPGQPNDMETNPNIPNVDQVSKNRIFAIHELEHLRIMTENMKNGVSISSVGEPQGASFYKDGSGTKIINLHGDLTSLIPKEDKGYVKKRLDYFLNPMELMGTSILTREMASVFIELLKYIDLMPPIKQPLYLLLQNRLKIEYTRITKRNY